MGGKPLMYPEVDQNSFLVHLNVEDSSVADWTVADFGLEVAVVAAGVRQWTKLECSVM
jgi:hypothetical protein